MYLKGVISPACVLALSARVIRTQENWHNFLAVTISRLNRLLITLVHRAGYTLEIMWPRNIKNGLWNFLYFCGIWSWHLRRREQSFYQLGHITIIKRHYNRELENAIDNTFIKILFSILIRWNALLCSFWIFIIYSLIFIFLIFRLLTISPVLKPFHIILSLYEYFTHRYLS